MYRTEQELEVRAKAYGAECRANRLRLAAAERAFYGSLPRLAEHLLDTHGYDWDGRHYPANGATLAEFIGWTLALSAADFAYFAS